MCGGKEKEATAIADGTRPSWLSLGGDREDLGTTADGLRAALTIGFIPAKIQLHFGPADSAAGSNDALCSL
jgi:hypothetical protein